MTKWTFALAALVVVVLAAVVGYVHYFYGKEWGGAALLIVAFVAYGLIEWMKTLSTTRAANTALVDAMQAIEGGNIKQFEAVKKFIEVEGAKAKKDNDELWRIERRQQPQLPAPDVWTVDASPRMLTARDDAEVAYE